MPEPVCYINKDSLTFFCPGCKEPHCIDVGENVNKKYGIKYGTNNDTFYPTIYGCSNRVNKGDYICCHFFIIKGKIYYWPDSFHYLKNKVCEMIPISQWYKPFKPEILFDSCLHTFNIGGIYPENNEESRIDNALKLAIQRRKEYEEMEKHARTH